MITMLKGKALKDTSYNELVVICHDHAFFRFMDEGRSGFEVAAENVIEVCYSFIVAKELLKERVRNLEDLSSEQYVALCADITQRMISGFIEGGSTELRSAIHQAYQVLISVLTTK